MTWEEGAQGVQMAPAHRPRAHAQAKQLGRLDPDQEHGSGRLPLHHWPQKTHRHGNCLLQDSSSVPRSGGRKPIQASELR